jgi:hypothetical protein
MCDVFTSLMLPSQNKFSSLSLCWNISFVNALHHVYFFSIYLLWQLFVFPFSYIFSSFICKRNIDGPNDIFWEINPKSDLEGNYQGNYLPSRFLIQEGLFSSRIIIADLPMFIPSSYTVLFIFLHWF